MDLDTWTRGRYPILAENIMHLRKEKVNMQTVLNKEVCASYQESIVRHRAQSPTRKTITEFGRLSERVEFSISSAGGIRGTLEIALSKK